MPNRKIVQIAACAVAENHMTQCEAYVHALCDDGTVWRLSNRDIDVDGFWAKVPAIPQDEPDAASEPTPAPVGRQSWPPEGLGGMDLWVRESGEAVQIIDRDTFWIAVASKDQIVAAFFVNDATCLLDMPGDALETRNFDYEGNSFTVPANPIPF